MSDLEYVYVVDDDHSLRRSISRSLTLRGYQVAQFESAEKFLAAFGNGHPGCLVLDYGMPGMTGLELQRYLIDNECHIPIVFITGHAGIPESVTATKAGAVDFLEKPYRLDVLIDRIETALELDRRQRRVWDERRRLQAIVAQLTPREKEVLQLMCARPDMTSSKAIARELAISPRTVDIHRSRIMEKARSSSVADLITRFGKIVAE